MKRQSRFGRKASLLIVLLPLFVVAVWISVRWVEIRIQLRSLAVLKEVGGEIRYAASPACGTDMNDVVGELTSIGCLLGVRPIAQPFVIDCEDTKLSDGQLCSISTLRYPVATYIARSSVTDTGLSYIGRNCRLLEGLSVGGNGITDAGVAQLKSLTHLEGLEIENASVTDKGLQPLFSLKNVQSLRLNKTSITDSGLEAITKHFPKLKSLRVGGTKVTDKGLLYLGRLTDLTDLSLDSDDITDVGADYLVGLVSLTSLSLANTRISDRGIESISRIPHLERLNVSGIKLSHRSLNAIVAIRSLKELNIRRTGVEKAEIDKVISGLPMLDVKHD
jgi:hypothetical protein